MDAISPFYMRIIATAVMILMAVSVIIVRLKASNRPVTIKKIIIPPLGMATGFAMFVEPQMRISVLYGVIAFAAGWLLFSYPLIRTTHFEMKGGQVFAKRSSGFAFILIGLLVIRLALHEVIEQYVSILQTGSLFFILAFGMIVRWRLYMLKKYRAITNQTDTNPINPEA
ncbi:CcdC family protein [Paenibacillus lutimineralis]|nr:cytochrome c biogenesis protein CcdC [Paenibacillus lutimineralis]